MIDRGKTLASFYRMLRKLLKNDAEKSLIIYFRDGRKIKMRFEVDQEERRLKLVND